jgi:hypothetical protein
VWHTNFDSISYGKHLPIVKLEEEERKIKEKMLPIMRKHLPPKLNYLNGMTIETHPQLVNFYWNKIISESGLTIANLHQFITITFLYLNYNSTTNNYTLVPNSTDRIRDILNAITIFTSWKTLEKSPELLAKLLGVDIATAAKINRIANVTVTHPYENKMDEISTKFLKLIPDDDIFLRSSTAKFKCTHIESTKVKRALSHIEETAKYIQSISANTSCLFLQEALKVCSVVESEASRKSVESLVVLSIMRYMIVNIGKMYVLDIVDPLNDLKKQYWAMVCLTSEALKNSNTTKFIGKTMDDIVSKFSAIQGGNTNDRLIRKLDTFSQALSTIINTVENNILNKQTTITHFRNVRLMLRSATVAMTSTYDNTNSRFNEYVTPYAIEEEYPMRTRTSTVSTSDSLKKMLYYLKTAEGLEDVIIERILVLLEQGGPEADDIFKVFQSYNRDTIVKISYTNMIIYKNSTIYSSRYARKLSNIVSVKTEFLKFTTAQKRDMVRALMGYISIFANSGLWKAYVTGGSAVSAFCMYMGTIGPLACVIASEKESKIFEDVETWGVMTTPAFYTNIPPNKSILSEIEERLIICEVINMFRNQPFGTSAGKMTALSLLHVNLSLLNNIKTTIDISNELIELGYNMDPSINTIPPADPYTIVNMAAALATHVNGITPPTTSPMGTPYGTELIKRLKTINNENAPLLATLLATLPTPTQEEYDDILSRFENIVTRKYGKYVAQCITTFGIPLDNTIVTTLRTDIEAIPAMAKYLKTVRFDPKLDHTKMQFYETLNGIRYVRKSLPIVLRVCAEVLNIPTANARAEGRLLSSLDTSPLTIHSVTALLGKNYHTYLRNKITSVIHSDSYTKTLQRENLKQGTNGFGAIDAATTLPASINTEAVAAFIKALDPKESMSGGAAYNTIPNIPHSSDFTDLLPFRQNAISIMMEFLTTDYANDRLNKFISSSIVKDKKLTHNHMSAIMSLNILPINVHALQRFVPWANIYNYSYTFESYLKHEHDSKDPTCEKFIELMNNPYAPVSTMEYGIPIHQNYILDSTVGKILRGSDKLGLGVPKFIACQLVNKVLLGSFMVSGKQNSENVFVQNTYNYELVYANKDARDVFRKGHQTNANIFNKLTYMIVKDKGESTEFKTIDLRGVYGTNHTTKNVMDFHLEGYERFNTRIVRNAIFLSNIQRVIRSKLNNVFVKAHNLVERSHRVADYNITEYNAVDPGSVTTPNKFEAY